MSISSIELQKILFDKTPLRSELVKIENDSSNKFSVKVFRNHSFELVSSIIGAYLKFAEMNVHFEYSDYDDSFSFFDFDDTADAVLLWMDLARYDIPDIQSFVSGRVQELKKKTRKPILVATTGKAVSFGEGVISFDVDSLKEEVGENFFDVRRESLTGTKLSNKACLAVAREMGTKYIPALFRPSLKAVVVDLDNTLYKGVLGEDGISGIILSEGHKALQNKLVHLAKEGFFICVVSKNDQGDVERMFEERADFPLRQDSLTVISASWQAKSQSIRDIAAKLNIGTDAMLFVDDNMGELSEVSGNIPGIHVLHAQDDAFKTLRALSCYPGLIKFSLRREDTLRQADVQANEQRKSLQQNLSHEEYLRNLGMELRILLDDEAGKGRIAELANKTNQFIFTYRRYTLAQVEELLTGENSVIVTLHLRDKLSDSGMIGAVVLMRQDDCAVLDEMYISCRALGRGIDDIIIFAAIRTGMDKLGVEKLRVNFVQGERNKPAEIFYEQYLCNYKEKATFVTRPESDLITIIHEGKQYEQA